MRHGKEEHFAYFIQKSKQIFLVFLAFSLISCGGGGGSISRDNTPTDPNAAPEDEFQISLSIAERDSGDANSQLSEASPLRVSATVTRRDNGAVVDGELVTFTFSQEDLATFDPQAGTAVTNADGIAVIDLIVGTVEGGGSVTASIASGETASIGFNSAGDADTGVKSLISRIVNKNSGLESNELNFANPLTVAITVTTSSGEPVVDELVTFAFDVADLAVFEPASGTAITDSNGIASIDLVVGSLAGGGIVTASLGSGESITVGFTSAGDADSGAKTVTMSIVDKESGLPSNELSVSTPLLVNALILDSQAQPVVDELITFTFSQDGLAFFVPDSGTALTNATGVATIELLVGEQAGAGKVIATTSTGETREIGFNSAGGGNVVTDPPAALDFFTSALQLSSSGADEVELIALVKDEDNVLMEGVEVSFSTDSGELVISQGTTAADGTARAILTSQNNPENRTITATAEVGTLTQDLEIQVVGTEININGPTSVILNDTAPITVVLADADGNGIANQEVTVTSSRDNGLSEVNPVTDQTGQVTVTYTASVSGTDVLTVTALNAQATQNIIVQEDEFNFTDAPTEDIALNTLQPLTVTWLKDNLPFEGGTIVFTTTRGTLDVTEGETDANGQVTVNISSTSAGAAVIGAQGTDAEGNVVNSSINVEFVATTVASVIVAANPNSIGPDGQKSTITAVLRDSLGNLVKGVQVGFTADDVSGGELFPPVATSDSNGLASTVYTSNTVTNEDAITITATESLGGLSASTNLTVADRAQFISIGTGNQIEVPTDSSYLKRFSVFVTDANSNPVDNVELTVTGTPVKYTELIDPNAEVGEDDYQEIRPAFFKGYWMPFPSQDAFQYWVSVQTIGCANEDVDDDAILDPSEDINGDGNLTPGNIVSITGNIVTDENGQAEIELRYPKTFAAWVTIKITVSTPVTGSESRVSQFYRLGAAASDLTIESTPPNTPPFGTGTNSVEDPDNPGTFFDDGANLTCTNLL